MPAQPAWFHRLEEILTLLWGFDIGYLDRQAPSDGDTRSPDAPPGALPLEHVRDFPGRPRYYSGSGPQLRFSVVSHGR